MYHINLFPRQLWYNNRITVNINYALRNEIAGSLIDENWDMILYNLA